MSERMESVRSVALGIWFKVGSRDELPEEAGISHFIEHMMFKGTPTRDARELSEAFDSLGAQQNAFTSKEATCYFASCIDESMPGVFELLADMVCNASFDEDACALEREVVTEEIARGEDDPEDQVYELFAKKIWPQHTLGLPIGGTRASVATFDQAAAFRFRNKHKGPRRRTRIRHSSCHRPCSFRRRNIRRGLRPRPRTRIRGSSRHRPCSFRRRNIRRGFRRRRP